MLVHLSTKRCECCGYSQENTILDIPFTAIKLAPFAIRCDCGYFYEGVHYNVSYGKWKVFMAIQKNKKEDILDRIKTEEKFLEEMPSSTYCLRRIRILKEELKVVESHLLHNAKPIPDHLWAD